LLVAKKRSALTALQEQFRARGAEHAVGKTYAALVAGEWPQRLKVIDVPLHKYLTAEGERRVRTTSPADEAGRRSITLVQVAQRLAGFTLLAVTIRTGRTHQIRVHLAGAGHAIAGDDKYGDFELNRRLAREGVKQGNGPPVRLARMFLHAQHLRIAHPATGEVLEFQSPLPEALARVVGALGPARA
ncbi:MAG: RluA family pseudouridine synthase, partial [Rubrivivax sp.]